MLHRSFYKKTGTIPVLFEKTGLGPEWTSTGTINTGPVSDRHWFVPGNDRKFWKKWPDRYLYWNERNGKGKERYQRKNKYRGSLIHIITISYECNNEKWWDHEGRNWEQLDSNTWPNALASNHHNSLSLGRKTPKSFSSTATAIKVKRLLAIQPSC